MIGSAGQDGLYPSNAGTIDLSARLGGDGGSITLLGSDDEDESNKSAGGSINLSAGLADGCPGEYNFNWIVGCNCQTGRIAKYVGNCRRRGWKY